MLKLSLFLSPLMVQLRVPGLDNKAPCVWHPLDPADLHPWSIKAKAIPARPFIYSQRPFCTVRFCKRHFFYLILLLKSAASCQCLSPYGSSLFPLLFSSCAFPSFSEIQEVLSCLPEPSVTELTGRCGPALWGSVYGSLNLNQDWGYCP